MKYALIGCGRIATNHVKAVLNNNLEFVAACDIELDNIETLLAKHNLEKDESIKRYVDYKEMIKNHPDLELIAIATSSGAHAEIALYCIDHGINVIIEKPMAMNIKDAEEIIKRSTEKGVKVCACHQNRFNVAVQKTRKALESGRFGKLSHGSIHVRWNRNKDYYTQAPWRGTWAEDGGCLMNQCIHGIDLLRWMMGNEVDTVYGVTRQQQHHYLEAEDVGMAVVTFKNGAVATIEGTELPDEQVVFCAHFDSVEFSDGAWDNATGSITIMELMHYFKANPPKRTVKFVWCGSEEIGLLGSWNYCEMHKDELDKIILNINFDMTGAIMGTSMIFGSCHKSLIDRAIYKGKVDGYHLDSHMGLMSSDSTSFALHGVPAMSFGTRSPRGGAEIHSRRDIMEHLCPDTFIRLVEFVAEYSSEIINAKINIVPRELPKEAKDQEAFMKSRLGF